MALNTYPRLAPNIFTLLLPLCASVARYGVYLTFTVTRFYFVHLFKSSGVRIFSTENQESADTGGRAVCGRSLAGIAGLYPAGVVDVSCEYCVLSGRGLCDGLIPRPEEYYIVYVCVVIRRNNEPLQ